MPNASPVNWRGDPLEMLRTMTRAREGDRREGILFRQGHGSMALPGAGHEAIAVLNECLETRDFLYPYYRDRALMLARGVSNYQMALTYYARAGSWSEGRLMSSHYSDAARNIVAGLSPTGSQCLPAAGTAWSCQLKGEGAVVMCFIGEAALRQGEFYEAWCFALQLALPLLFVVEDNGWGISTPTANLTPWNIGALSPERLERVDGRDVCVVFDAAQTLVSRARNGGGPGVLWMELDRLWSHTASDDHRLYRDAAELESHGARDPIEALLSRLVDEGLIERDAWKREQERIAREVEIDYARAELAPTPTRLWTNRDMEIEARNIVVSSTKPSSTKTTMLGAINSALWERLESDERVILLGQDIEDPKGGVFGLTKGLSRAFPNRVFNSPLAEATIAGVAVGACVAGLRPIFEIQFVDFIGMAWNQLANQIATLRWRSADTWRCPAIFLVPCGAYLPGGGPWHSQSNEALFAHIPGLLVAYPSTPADAAALLDAAAQLNDPVVFLLPKHGFRREFPEAKPSTDGFGVASIRLQGDDVTVVSWGNGAQLALDAAASLQNEGVSCEVLDLRTLVPCDWNAIQKSLEKTGRLVVVQEDNLSCSFGQSLIERATTDAAFWNQLAARPQLVSRADSHIPFNSTLELALLPSVQDVRRAVKVVLEA